jgi:hypothetical protein
LLLFNFCQKGESNKKTVTMEVVLEPESCNSSNTCFDFGLSHLEKCLTA